MIQINRYNIIAAITGLITICLVVTLALWLLKPSQEKILKLTSGGQGGTYNTFATALAEVVNANSKKIKIKVQESSGANDNVKKISSGKSDIGFIQSDTIVSDKIKIAAKLFPEVFHLIANVKSGIKNVSDIRGKRIALPPQGAGSNTLFFRLMKHYEIPSSEITVLNGTLNENIEYLKKDEADALFIVMGMGNEKVKSVIKNQDVTLISIDQANAISLFDPALSANTIPVGAYSGEKPEPSEPIQVISTDSLFAVSEKLDNEIVKELTRLLFEKRQDILRKIPQGAFIDEPTALHKLSFDIHKGADSFYRKDDPPFIVEYAEPMAFILSVILLLGSAAWQAQTWLSGARKNRADHYNLELVEIVNRAEVIKTLQEANQLRTEMFIIFEKFLDDMDNDRIEETSLHSFQFAWQVASSTLNHREMVLSNNNS